ncbi:Chain length determinant protein [Hydrocarboniphaga daqingensis]|uniref:Chain length determinant protein n=1 Tax=Hydrocarboniphaga daqingensis TaxID=490188 RepID=A0A1M5SBB1_9GAMM|nr:hypothetical protein [Hydrocarboniphaga daqingensis]SHH35730.1 Chain length determinant protein [Hydrocarboniphaga daqingensis]
MRQVENPEFDVAAAVRLAFRYWKSLLAASVIGGVTAVAASFLITKTYKAEATLFASDELSVSPMGALGGQLGALGSLAGLSTQGDRQLEALAVLRSRALVEDYIREKDLLPIIFYDEWDSAAGRWKTTSASATPTVTKAFKLFDKRIRKIAEQKKAGTVKITVEWKDPKVAAEWLRDLVDRANSRLREQSVQRSERNIAYINDLLAKTSAVELRSALYKLLEAEIKRLMVARGSLDYAYRFVDPPFIPEEKSGPKRSVYGLLGIFLGIALALGRAYWVSDERKAHLKNAPTHTADQ